MRYLGITAMLNVCLMATFAPVQAQMVRDAEAETAYQTGLEQLSQEDWDGAFASFSRALKLDETDLDVEAMVGRGDALREMEDYSNAQESYMSALLKDRDNRLSRAHYGHGVCSRELGRIDEAFASFNDAIDIDRNDPEIATDLGSLLINYGEDIVGGIRYLDRAIELDPENAEAYRYRALGYAGQGEFDKAIEDLTKSAEIDPTEYLTYDTLARVYINEEEFEEAVSAFERAIETYVPEKSSDPNIYANGYLELSRTRIRLATEEDTTSLQREEIYAAVLADAEKVLEEYPDHMPETGYAYYRMGQALRLQKRYGEAIKVFTEAIQLVPGGRDGPYIADAYLKRGICRHYQGQDSLARPDFEQSASIRFEDPLPNLWLGYSYAQDGDYREAIKNYGDAIAKGPDLAIAHVNRGLAYMQLGEFSKAVDNFNEAIRHEPTKAEHYYKRGVAHLNHEDFQKALDSYDMALLYDNESAKSHRGAAKALRALGRDTLAVQHEELATSLDK